MLSSPIRLTMGNCKKARGFRRQFVQARHAGWTRGDAICAVSYMRFTRERVLLWCLIDEARDYVEDKIVVYYNEFIDCAASQGVESRRHLRNKCIMNSPGFSRTGVWFKMPLVDIGDDSCSSCSLSEDPDAFKPWTKNARSRCVQYR